jgi:uncharacterized repeat protein (TIGR03943 family)
MRREAQAVLLVLIGGTLLKISIAGSYLRYVRVGLRPFLIAAGVVLVAVGVATLWQVLARRPGLAGRQVARPSATTDSHNDAHHHDDAHHAGHRHGRFDVAWLLVLPVLGLLLIAPPPLGTYAASRSGTAAAAVPVSRLPPLPEGDPTRISVLDYAARAITDHGRTLRGRRVTMSGFLLAGDSGQWFLTRMVITCCAADASPVKVGLTGDVPDDLLVAGVWIEVVGRFTEQTTRDTVNDETIPYVQVETAHAIPAPKQQYVS